MGDFLHLRVLNLSGNGITHIENLDHLAGSLVELSLARNALRRLDGLEALVSLQRLDVSGNFVQHLSSDLSKLALLRFFDASGNNLARLQEVNVLQPLPHLAVACLSANPVCALPQYREHVILLLPALESLDGAVITADHRRAAMARCGRHDNAPPPASAEAVPPSPSRGGRDGRRLGLPGGSDGGAGGSSAAGIMEVSRLREELSASAQLLRRKNEEWAAATERLAQ